MTSVVAWPGRPATPCSSDPTLFEVNVTPVETPVPEPATLLLLGAGLIGLGRRAWRTRG